jgi:hypothetical protein
MQEMDYDSKWKVEIYMAKSKKDELATIRNTAKARK